MTGGKVRAAIIGSGNIGTDLMVKIGELSDTLEVSALVGVEPESKGLARARELGVATTHGGLEGFLGMPESEATEIVFDATSASAHLRHSGMLRDAGKQVVDLTPAAVGPYVVPPVNLEEHTAAANVSMVSCGGQATVPVVAAVGRVADVAYAEMVSAIASDSAGPGTRANIDEFTRTTADALVRVGGATQGRAIIILNPARPPLVMRNTIFCLVADCDREAVAASVGRMVREVQGYVPGYRLKQEVQFEPFDAGAGSAALGPAAREARLKVTVFLEVEGAGRHLPSYSGNLDIMTSAAMRAGEMLARRRVRGAAP